MWKFDRIFEESTRKVNQFLPLSVIKSRGIKKCFHIILLKQGARREILNIHGLFIVEKFQHTIKFIMIHTYDRKMLLNKKCPCF